MLLIVLSFESRGLRDIRVKYLRTNVYFFHDIQLILPRKIWQTEKAWRTHSLSSRSKVIWTMVYDDLSLLPKLISFRPYNENVIELDHDFCNISLDPYLYYFDDLLINKRPNNFLNCFTCCIYVGHFTLNPRKQLFARYRSHFWFWRVFDNIIQNSTLWCNRIDIRLSSINLWNKAIIHIRIKIVYF